MATIRFRRGNTDPTSIQPTGLTMGEPVFNKELNTFWIGGSGPDGFTAIWVGAEIENTLNLENASQYKLATQYAIVNQIKTIVGASAGVQTIEGLSGQIDLIFGTGISGSTSPGAITLENTGVTRLGFSGDWRTRGVTNFNGAATGGVTLGAEVWQGNATPILNTMSPTSVTLGITQGTVLTGKTPMQILEMMLLQYLNPTIAFAAAGMGFNAVGSATTTSTRALAFGMTLDEDNSFAPVFTATNTTNYDAAMGVTISASLTTGNGVGITGSSGVIRSQIFSPVQTTNTFTAFSVPFPYRGVSYSSSTGVCQATFTLTATDTRGQQISGSVSYNWHPRFFSGRSNNAGLTVPPDAWKVPNTLPSGNTTGTLMTSTNSRTPNTTIVFPAGSPDEFLYFFIDSYYSPNTVSADGQPFGLFGGGTANTIVDGITIDDGFTLRQYRRYRSNDPQASAYTLILN